MRNVFIRYSNSICIIDNMIKAYILCSNIFHALNIRKFCYFFGFTNTVTCIEV